MDSLTTVDPTAKQSVSIIKNDAEFEYALVSWRAQIFVRLPTVAMNGRVVREEQAGCFAGMTMVQ